MNSANMNDFGMDSRSLVGSLSVKLDAVREAGFSQIMLCAQDLVSHPGGVDAAVACVQASGLRLTAFQAKCDFEGQTGPLHAYKLDVAQAMLGMCHALRCHLLVLPSSSLASGVDSPQVLIRDLRQLAMLAIPMNIKVAYQGWAGGAVVQDFLQAWDLVCEADMPNLGLCLDSHALLAANTPPDDLEMLDTDKLFLMQLADLLGSSNSAHQAFRVFPGDGAHRAELATLVTTMHTLGYRGAYSLAAFNDDYLAMPPQHVAQRARSAALWLGQEVLQRSVPLPNQIRLRRALAA